MIRFLVKEGVGRVLKIGERFNFKDQDGESYSATLMDTGEVIVWWYPYEFELRTIFFDVIEAEEMIDNGQWLLQEKRV